jgi:hypothetical protein
MKLFVILFVLILVLLLVNKTEHFSNSDNADDSIENLVPLNNLTIKLPESLNTIMNNSNTMLRSIGLVIYNSLNEAQTFNNLTNDIEKANNIITSNNVSLDILNNSIGDISNKLQNFYTDATTNERLYYLNIKNNHIEKRKIMSMYISLVIAVILGILLILTYFQFIPPKVTTYLYVVGIIGIVFVIVYYSLYLPGNRNSLYWSKFDFPKPSKSEVLKSELEYEKAKTKCQALSERDGQVPGINDNFNLSIKQFINK